MPASSPDLRHMPYLSAEQQSLLLAALESNRRAKESIAHSPNGKSGAPQPKTSLKAHSSDGLGDDSPLRDAPINSKTEPVTFGDTLFPDFLDSNTNFDVDFPTVDDGLLNDYPSMSTDGTNGDSGDGGEKRKSPEDDSDDDDEDDNGKRREGDEKVAKKPGRKLITTEPTTKRKAQNRAAQRAFRERKEKHVKDLEQKVSELEKVSDTTTQENSVLRAEIDRLQSELSDYKKRLSVGGNALGTSSTLSGLSSLYPAQSGLSGYLSDFQFDFTKFGSPPNNTSTNATSFDNNTIQSAVGANDRNSTSNNMTTSSSTRSGSNGQSPTKSRKSQSDKGPDVIPFEPGIFAGLGNVDYSNNFESPQDLGNTSSHTDSSRHNSQSNQSRTASSASSPCSSTGLPLGSSCGTSPEPVPNYNNDTSKSSGDLSFGSSALFQDQFPGMGPNQALYDFSNVDWLSNQNGGQFNPQLFGDYRESQAAVIGDGDFTSGFFEDPYSFQDFGGNTAGFNFDIANTTDTIHDASKNTKPEAPASANAAASLMEQVARCRNGETGREPGMSNGEIMTTHKLWHELQSCPKFLSGDLDIDSLCSELSAKATCSETGMAVPKDVVEKVLWRLAGVPSPGDKPSAEQARAAQWNELYASTGKSS